MLLASRKDEAINRFYKSVGFRDDEKTGYVVRPSVDGTP
jgi:hypothetical protein